VKTYINLLLLLLLLLFMGEKIVSEKVLTCVPQNYIALNEKIKTKINITCISVLKIRQIRN
jgi:hypothetical protein